MSQISLQPDTIEAGFNGRPIPVLIVEDDIDFADAIRGYLAAHGFAPRILSSAERLMEELQSAQPRLLVLDQFVGGLDLSLMLMSIRRQFSGPILLLSGNTDPTDRILSLERGADDYIVKTAPPREILARMRASLRRFGPTPAPDAQTRIARAHGWSICQESRALTNPAGESLTLTNHERDVAWALFRSSGQEVRRDQFFPHLALHDPANGIRRVDNLISRLRTIIGSLGGLATIEAVRGHGYTLRDIIMLPTEITNIMTLAINMPVLAGSHQGNVLVVDDNLDVAEALTSYLQMVGFEALSTDDPGSVIARLRADPAISVVVTDLRMPGMDGLELARAIATDLDANHPTEVILISGHATLEVAFDAGRNPIFGFLAKPLRPRMLADMIRAAIEAAHRRQPRPSLNHAGKAPVVTDDTPDNQPYPILRGAFAKVVHRVPLWRRQSTINLDANRRVAGDPAALADVLSECLVRVACDAEPGSIIAVTVMDNESGIRFRVENPDTPGSTPDPQNIATLDAAIDAAALRAGVRVTRGTTSHGGRLIEVDADALQPDS